MSKTFHPVGWTIQIRENRQTHWCNLGRRWSFTRTLAIFGYNRIHTGANYTKDRKRGLARVVQVGYME